MSYIVGIKLEDVTSIMCDTRVSFNDGSGQNTSLKSGRLFPGCIYGAAGNANSMREFIKDCKLYLSTKEKRPLTVYWEKFEKFIDTHMDNDVEHFQLVLSSRHTSEARLYSFDSKTKIIKEGNHFVSIGSGKAMLDEELKKYIDATKDMFIKQLKENNWELVFYPNFYCLWLMERVQGVESIRLQDIGVGGHFHYSYQTSVGEARQEPSVYVLSKRFGNTIYSYVHHITFEEAALVIACTTEDKRSLILDAAAWMRCETFLPEESKAYADRIFRLVDKQQYYVFCGFGFLDLKQRDFVHCHMTKDKNECIINREGKLEQEHVDIINSVYSATVN
ncbi:MAG: hypothetical protein WC279_00425 [Sulfurimonas sp.]|jgi:ATP-dependent protease HslVU (ClpYQ) peptidase subunit|uniref:hypothetical protein n=1 Tax=Sulfurimonas sp. TaxID=2022749 RepID=UPI0035694E1B